MSKEHIIFLKKIKREKILVTSLKIAILVVTILIWELLYKFNIINGFISSSPSKVLLTTIELFKHHDLFIHIMTTLTEVLISFTITTTISLFISILLWRFKLLNKVLDPYLTILNSLPKVALGPLLIIIIGANQKSIITMAILITVFTSIISMYAFFINTDCYKINLLKSFKANNYQIFSKVVFRGNLKNIISILKVNISLILIGTIMGELLVSKKGLGYLITYGTQTFNLNLVITSIVILGIISFVLYKFIDIIEKKVKTT